MTLNAYPRALMTDEERNIHIGFMREAIVMAQFALDNSETPVGCVLVHDNRVISRGTNDTNRSFNGTRHAEFVALDNYWSRGGLSRAETNTIETRELGQEDNCSCVKSQKKTFSPDILVNCTLYVTVEPCIMCASLLRQIGIKRVFFGASNDRFGGAGGVISVHKTVGLNEDGCERNGDYEVSGGWLREEAIMLLRRFYVQENERAPEPRDKGKRVLNHIIDPIVDAEDTNLSNA